MAQQAPKVAQNLAQRFFTNLKSKEFRDYLMRWAERREEKITWAAITLYKNIQQFMALICILIYFFHCIWFAAHISGDQLQIGEFRSPLWLIFAKIHRLSVAKWLLVGENLHFLLLQNICSRFFVNSLHSSSSSFSSFDTVFGRVHAIRLESAAT